MFRTVEHFGEIMIKKVTGKKKIFKRKSYNDFQCF